MSAAVDVSTGLTLTIGSAIGEVQKFDWSGVTRNAIPTSSMGTAAPAAGRFGNMTYIPGKLSDPGQIVVEAHFNPDTEPLIDDAAQTCTLQFAASGGDTTGASWAASGFVTEYNLTGELEDKMVYNMTIKLSGEVTVTAGV